jgi:protein-S-isoprenylcysteine O-methyltransferase Ste14
MLQSPYAILILMWLIFAVAHSGLASGVVMRGVGSKMGKYYRPTYSLIVLVLIFLLVHQHFTAEDTIMWHPHWLLKIVSALLVLSGFAAIVISLWKHLLAYSGIGALLDIEPAPGFAKDGLHKYVRHPMYTGVLFFLWGVFIGYPYMNNLVSAICFTVYCFLGIYFLERKLSGSFGEEYQKYKTKVPMLLPNKIKALNDPGSVG